MTLLAQHGYGKGNKIYQGIANGDISGVILSPKSESPEKLKSFASELSSNYGVEKIFFDPQLYVANMQGDINEGKLPNYPYYESNLSRSKLSNPVKLNEYIKRVIDFEMELNVSSCFAPTIIISDFDNVSCQIAISMAYATIPHIKEKKIYISLCISEKAFLNRKSMEEFLNIISLLDVDGFYIIVDKENNTQKTTLYDINALPNIMKFIYNLSIINQFDIIIGYSDVISILFATISNADFSTGWYMNLKQFSSDNFIYKSGGRRPRKRYTSTALFGSILLNPEIQVLNRGGFTEKILSNSKYDFLIYPEVKSNEWTDEISCLSNWNALNNELIELKKINNIDERLNYLSEKINNAETLYKKIINVIPQLDQKSNNSHLRIWKESIQVFREDVGA